MEERVLAGMDRPLKLPSKSKSATRPRRKMLFILIEVGIYILSIWLFVYLMDEVWQKYIKKSTTTVSHYDGNGNGLLPLPLITLCPTSAFKTRNLILTQEDYERESYSADEIFYNLTQLKLNFNISEINTVANGKCFILKDKSKRKAKEQVIIHVHRTTDLVVYFYDSYSYQVMFF